MDTERERRDGGRDGAFDELERRVRAALETYSNVHRGDGHFSRLTTEMYERARGAVLECLGLEPARYEVVFGTPRASEALKRRLRPGDCREASSRDVGLPLGVRALAVRKRALPGGRPFLTGGSVVRLVSRTSAVWAGAPQRFEAGTPSVMNVIAFAAALRLTRERGPDCFRSRAGAGSPAESLRSDGPASDSGPRLVEELRRRSIGRGLPVPTADGERPFLNCDHAASTPAFEPVWDAVRRTWRETDEVRAGVVREVSQVVAEFFGASPERYDVVFSGNTTEAVNTLARSLGRTLGGGAGWIVLNTLLEHNSNELPWRDLPGASLVHLPVDAEGFVDPGELERVLRRFNRGGRRRAKRVRLVAVSGASNVLGTFNDIPAIVRTAHRYGARVLVDGAQLAAHRRVDLEAWDVDYFVFSGHKAYAPFGSGALILKKGLVRGDRAEWDAARASGEENVVGIAALGQALALLRRADMDLVEAGERALVRRLLIGLARIRGVEVFGIADPDSPRLDRKGAVVSFRLRGVPHNLAAKELAERGGIGVRSGCFCAHLLVQRLLRISPLRAWSARAAMRLAPRWAGAVLPGLVRVSFGLENESGDVDRLLECLEKIAAAPRSLFDRLMARTKNAAVFVPRNGLEKGLARFFETRLRLV